MDIPVAVEQLRLQPWGMRRSAHLLQLARRNPLGMAGGLVVVGLIVVALFAPLIATYSPYALNAEARFSAPGPAHLFGTDDLGRDIFSRVVYGARISLEVGFISVVGGTIAGAALGLISAYFGGTVDFWLERFIDALFSFPTIILALTIVAALGPGLANVIIAIAIASVPRMARVVRVSALSLMTQPQIEAAKCIGCGNTRIILRHLLPNCLAPIIVLATANFGITILAEAALSYLGVGVPPPASSWGALLSGPAQQYIRLAPWMAIFPGVVITIVVLGSNLFGDSLRDILDPRLRTH